MDFFFSAGVEKDPHSDKWVFSPQKAAEPSQDASDDVQNAKYRSDSIASATSDVSSGPVAAQEVGSAAISKAKKKRLQKKKKSASQLQHVSWGSVEEICFTRSISYSSVPNKGMYPLGLGEVEDTQRYTVDEYFIKQQLLLMDRARALGLPIPTANAARTSAPVVPVPPPALKSRGSPASCGKGKKTLAPEAPPAPPAASPAAAPSSSANDSNSSGGGGSKYMSPLLETRQFDYRAQSHNPLFHPTSEDERIAKLMVNKADWNKLVDTSSAAQDGHHYSVAETLNREIKSIKTSRDDQTGCSCKHVKIDKLSVVKMKQELLTHGHLIHFEGSKAEVEVMKKPELTVKVKEILAICSLCVENNCECVAQGVPCSNVVCGCLRGGGVVRPAGQLAQACANPHGAVVFNPEEVGTYRKRVITESCSGESAKEKRE